MSRPIPYPADTRAKGWRFELDYEKIEQSDTWSLAAEVPMAQHSLLMMWMMAWTQVPCGSLPNDTAIIRAKCKVPPKMWTPLQPVLMRGWWLAEDGRLYHDTIVERVLEMLAHKDKEKTRKAAYRARMAASVTDLSRGTDSGRTPDSHGSDDTGTGIGTIGIGIPPFVAEELHGFNTHNAECDSTPGAICKAMKVLGIADPNPGHPDLLMLLEAGATAAEFEGAARTAVAKRKGFAYALGTLKGTRKAAAEALQTLHTGPLPTAQTKNRQEVLEAANFAAAQRFAQQGEAHEVN